MCKCKCAIIDKRRGYDPGKHQSVVADFLCPMCENKTMRYYMHGETDISSYIVLECSRCRSYVRYILAGDVMKDELYFSDSSCLVRERGEKDYVWGRNPLLNESSWTDIPAFEITRELFMDKERLLNKIKTYVVFQ